MSSVTASRRVFIQNAVQRAVARSKWVLLRLLKNRPIFLGFYREGETCRFSLEKSGAKEHSLNPAGGVSPGMLPGECTRVYAAEKSSGAKLRAQAQFLTRLCLTSHLAITE